MNATETNVMVATPAYAGLSSGYVSSLLALGAILGGAGIRWTVFFEASNPLIPHARATIVDAFMQSSATHCLMLDADVSYDAETVTRLIDLGVDFSGVAVPKRIVNVARIQLAAAHGHSDPMSFGLEYCIQLPTDAAPGDDGTIEVDSVGGAFVLVTRKVIADLRAANPELRFLPRDSTRPVWDLFSPIIESGAYYSEDISFCRRWRRLGGSIRVLLDAPVQHAGPTTVTGNLAAQFPRRTS